MSIYIPWPFPPVWGVADNTKEQQKQWGPHSVPLAMTRTQPSLDGTAGATQPILPRLPQLTSLHRCHLPYCPYHRVAPIRQPRGNNSNTKYSKETTIKFFELKLYLLKFLNSASDILYKFGLNIEQFSNCS